MPPPNTQPGLFPAPEVCTGAVTINDRCLLRTQDGYRVVIVSGVVLAHYAVGDGMAEHHAMVNLVEQGCADQNDVARAFGCSTRSLRRYQRRFETDGLVGLGRRDGYPKGRPRMHAGRRRLVTRLKTEGLSNREVARRMGTTEKAVRNLLRRMGWKQEPGRAQTVLPFPAATGPDTGSTGTADAGSVGIAVVPPADPNLSAAGPAEVPGVGIAVCPAADSNLSADPADGEPVLISFDRDPADRRYDRLLAYKGLLEDAAPMFRPGSRVPGAGVLLALPALLHSGVLQAARQTYGSIGPAFYGLRTSILALLLMALLRIKRPEAIKERSPDDLGRILGLDRAPEVKTLRRKLARLVELGSATYFGRALARRRIAARGDAMGFLYVDGHVRVYHGKHVLPKAHVTRLRISLPATTDYWINDREGEPLFVVTAEANAGMVQMLPPVLAEVRKLIGERRLTVVFDRGGWSPKLFDRLIRDGFDILTYRKGRSQPVPRRRFQEHRAVIDGGLVVYTLADQGVRVGRGLRLRQVTRLSDDASHQTPILTSRRDLPAIEVAYRMFERWRQENFFKYLREEYALDALAEHKVEPADPMREIPNPRHKKLTTELRKTRAGLERLQALYGSAAFDSPGAQPTSVRGLNIADALRAYAHRIAELEVQRTAVPRRVAVSQAISGPVVRLAAEKKHLTNLLKMVAYQAESDLVRLVAPHYRRAEDEGRTLVQSMLASPADIEVDGDELRVLVHPLSSAHRTRALEALCTELDAQHCVFPGSRLRLRYAVARCPPG